MKPSSSALINEAPPPPLPLLLPPLVVVSSTTEDAADASRVSWALLLPLGGDAEAEAVAGTGTAESGSCEVSRGADVEEVDEPAVELGDGNASDAAPSSSIITEVSLLGAATDPSDPRAALLEAAAVCTAVE